MCRSALFAAALAVSSLTGCPAPSSPVAPPAVGGAGVATVASDSDSGGPLASEPGEGWTGLTFGKEESGFVQIRGVARRSPAAKAGLRRGEWIVGIEGKPARGLGYLQGVIDAKDAGDVIALRIAKVADGAPRDVSLPVAPLDLVELCDDAISAGAALLARTQEPAGGWRRKGAGDELGLDAPLTALCLRTLAVLPEEGRVEHGAVLTKARAFLLGLQGDHGGVVGHPTFHHHRNYATALTLQALTILGESSTETQRLRDYLIQAQLDEGEAVSEYKFGLFGGWNYYDEASRSSLEANLSVTSFALEALARSGNLAGTPTARQALLFLKRTQNLPHPAPADRKRLLDGGFAFSPRDSKAGQRVFPDGEIIYRPYGSATADGLRSLLLLGVDVEDERAQAALNWLTYHFSVEENTNFGTRERAIMAQGVYFYYLCSLTDALERCGQSELNHSAGPIPWPRLVAMQLLARQREDDSWRGEVSVMNEDDPTQATALAVLTLLRCRAALARPE